MRGVKGECRLQTHGLREKAPSQVANPNLVCKEHWV